MEIKGENVAMEMDFNNAPPQAKTLEEAQAIIDALWLLCRQMRPQIIKLEGRIRVLEAQLNQNSGNSSKPPSSDGYQKPKPKSLRGKSGKSPGGQPGHPRHILEKHSHPDKVIYHILEKCSHCCHNLVEVKVLGYETRQVFDIPPLRIEVTEHRAEQKVCPHCCLENVADFPKDVLQPTQYGNTLKGLATYLNQYQFIPYDRLQDFFVDIFNHTISQGMLVKINQQCYKNLEAVESAIKKQLTESSYLHHDETGIRIEGKLHWCHVASTSKLTSYGIYPMRGKEAMETMDILSRFKGRLVHDFFRPYFSYNCKHALCNAHHLRELKFIEEECEQEWAKYMADLLLAIKSQVEWHQTRGLALSEQRIDAYARCYDEILMMGLWHPGNISRKGIKRQRGYAKQSKAKNLLDRLRFHRFEVLAFMYDFQVPFTNNQAEQDIRMLKVKQKVSGCFRSSEGAQWFARIKSYISTARKHQQNILQVLQNAFADKPFTPIRA